MVESICGQGFAYAHEVEEDWAKELVKLGLEATSKRDIAAAADEKSSRPVRLQGPYYKRSMACDPSLILGRIWRWRHDRSPDRTAPAQARARRCRLDPWRDRAQPQAASRGRPSWVASSSKAGLSPAGLCGISPASGRATRRTGRWSR
jgi:hypothetical protein